MFSFHAEAQANYEPDTLTKLFKVDPLLDLDALFASTDPLAYIDPNDNSGVLSPVGFVHLFRQYFFDLGTFLGEPVEHVWLAPGTTVELIEVSTRRTLIERTEESVLENTQKTERSDAVKDEISDAIRAENEASTKLGVSTTNSVDFGVYQGSATASVSVDNARKDARENVHKRSREQAEKLSTEIKRSFKSVFRTVTEATDTRTRRYVLSNPGLELVNYELRRKMRRVGVQLQDLGTQLCWQVFVDDPGSALGLAELVHYAESPDLANIKEPDPLPPPDNIVNRVTVPIKFRSGTTSDNGGALYAWKGKNTDGSYYGNRVNTDIDEEKDKRIYMGVYTFLAPPPQANYELKEVRPIGAQSGQVATARDSLTAVRPDGFDLVMQQLQFNGQQDIAFDIDLVFKPTDAAKNDWNDLKEKANEKYNAEVFRVVKKSYMDSVRDRIKAAHGIASRPSWDLREEERTVVYRGLLRRLMLDSWSSLSPSLPSWLSPGAAEQRRLSHVRSEIVRAIFDVDAMLYFVAPEWWMPREHRTSHTFDPEVAVKDQTVNLTEENKRRWKDVPKRRDNYSITEESRPARLGSSLGWLMQLDGDNLRNAFLNAPWVKAVIPIRPGRETAALNWLKAVEGEDGWDAEFVPSTDEDAQLVAEVEADGNPPELGFILQKIAEKLTAQNSGIAQTLESDKVFESGFDPLVDSFDAGLPANEIFSQWISVLPTDQVVAVPYEPTNLLED